MTRARPGARSGARHRAGGRAARRWWTPSPVTALGAVLAVLVVAPATGTLAYFVDTSEVTSGSVGALTVAAPTSPVCTNGTGLAPEARMSWTSAGSAYSYRVVVTRTDTGATVTNTTQTGTTITFTNGTYGSAAVTTIPYRATVTSFPTGVTTWPSAGSISVTFRSRALGTGTQCT